MLHPFYEMFFIGNWYWSFLLLHLLPKSQYAIFIKIICVERGIIYETNNKVFFKVFNEHLFHMEILMYFNGRQKKKIEKIKIKLWLNILVFI